jgi:(p)ppGpp synthase/HD superfamily hydrolase
MATIERALQIAAQAHEGQGDREGLPYILHSLRMMMSVEGEEARIVAVLHDVVEGTPVTPDDLRQAGFSEGVLAAVTCVTHRKDDLRGHPLAADLRQQRVGLGQPPRTHDSPRRPGSPSMLSRFFCRL